MTVRNLASLVLPSTAILVALTGALFGACSSTNDESGGADGSSDAPLVPSDASGDAGAPPDANDGSALDSAATDAAPDAAPFVTGMSIASAYGTPLEGAPGDGIPLVVILSMSDGTTRQAPAGDVTWVAPETILAQDPSDAGGDILPEAGALPTAFYVRNDLRHLSPGALFLLDPGTASNPQVTVTASLADAGQVSATVTILPARVGDPDAGGNLFVNVLACAGCHGATANGSPLAVMPDGGAVLLDGSPGYVIGGQDYPYPAPGLNAAPGSGHLAADPAWTEPMFATAAQADMDNAGVALRQPMPTWLGGNDGTGHPLDAQSFADIYAWLKTQTH